MKQQIDCLVAPNASGEYRKARQALYDAEKNLMQQVERVAQMRRDLPEGPEVPDYEFIGADGPVRLSQLFEAVGSRISLCITSCTGPTTTNSVRCARDGSTG